MSLPAVLLQQSLPPLPLEVTFVHLARPALSSSSAGDLGAGVAFADLGPRPRRPPGGTCPRCFANSPMNSRRRKLRAGLPEHTLLERLAVDAVIWARAGLCRSRWSRLKGGTTGTIIPPHGAHLQQLQRSAGQCRRGSAARARPRGQPSQLLPGSRRLCS